MPVVVKVSWSFLLQWEYHQYQVADRVHRPPARCWDGLQAPSTLSRTLSEDGRTGPWLFNVASSHRPRAGQLSWISGGKAKLQLLRCPSPSSTLTSLSAVLIPQNLQCVFSEAEKTTCGEPTRTSVGVIFSCRWVLRVQLLPLNELILSSTWINIYDFTCL